MYFLVRPRLFMFFAVFSLLGCQNAMTPPMWWEKTNMFGEFCQQKGHEEGSSKYLACIERQYQKEKREAEEREQRMKRNEYNAKHNSSGLWNKNKLGLGHISDGPIQPEDSTTHGISLTN